MINKFYSPTNIEKKNIGLKNDCFKVSGDQVFATLQGEGLFENEKGTAGCPAVFLRLQFCNLSCGLKSGWKCDTGYTWDKNRKEYWKESTDWTIEETKKKIEDAWFDKFSDIGPNKKRVVITGGEPLLQQINVIKLIKIMPNWQFEIETNGTIMPAIELSKCQINCSPKLKNSGNSKKARLKPKILKEINKWSKSWFKFVVIDKNDLSEIEEIIVKCKLNHKKILLMPEGTTLEENQKHIKNIEKIAKDKKWRISYRNQIIWFGQKRRT